MNSNSYKLLTYAGLLLTLVFSGCSSVKDALAYDGVDVAEERKIQDQQERIEGAKFPNTHVIGVGADVK